jgi:hypothetical protein
MKSQFLRHQHGLRPAPVGGVEPTSSPLQTAERASQQYVNQLPTQRARLCTVYGLAVYLPARVLKCHIFIHHYCELFTMIY